MASYYKHVNPSALLPPVDLKQKKVLVVEDFFNFRVMLKNMLKTFDIKDIDEAANGDEATRRLAMKRYDIVLCDYNLGPGKDGQQVLEEAKHKEYIGYSAVWMMITAENTMDMFMGALEYQPDDYMMKPFTKEALEKKLKDLVRKKETLREVEKAWHRKDYEAVVRLCDTMIESNAKSRTELLKVKGEALLELHQYPEADAHYEKVLAMGNLPWAHLGLGKAKFQMSRLEEAKEIFLDLIARNKNHMAAYDWLAKTEERIGRTKEAQEILMEAVQISPKAILRQKALGEIAMTNADLTVAEKALRETVVQGKNSIFKHHKDYIKLSDVLVKTGAPEKGINVLAEADHEFEDNPEASLQLAVAEGVVYTQLHEPDKAKAAAEKAVHAASSLGESIPPELELDMAKAFFLSGDEEKGTEIVRRIVQSNHEDEVMIGHLQDVFEDIAMSDVGAAIIDTARGEVVKLNNDGVRLVREGKLENAIDYFKEAAAKLPQNKIINANAAQSLILYMKKFGAKKPLYEAARTYLAQVHAADPAYRDLEKLLDALSKLKAEV